MMKTRETVVIIQKKIQIKINPFQAVCTKSLIMKNLILKSLFQTKSFKLEESNSLTELNQERKHWKEKERKKRPKRIEFKMRERRLKDNLSLNKGKSNKSSIGSS